MTDPIPTSPSGTDLLPVLLRIAAALERSAPPARPAPDFAAADAFVWQPEGRLQPVPRVNRVEMGLLRGIDRMRDILFDNTERFARGLPANNALLWGARGMGKSSLVKAVHAEINARARAGLGAAAEARRDPSRGHRGLPALMGWLRPDPHRFVVFCDDLSFDAEDTSYKSLKAALDGGIEGRPDNVIFYATSNRRHLLPRDMMENERSTAINPGEAVEEKVSLSDRFGLWLGFHKCSQDEYLAMIDAYVARYGLTMEPERLRAEALEWSTTRGRGRAARRSSTSRTWRGAWGGGWTEVVLDPVTSASVRGVKRSPGCSGAARDVAEVRTGAGRSYSPAASSAARARSRRFSMARTENTEAS